METSKAATGRARGTTKSLGVNDHTLRRPDGDTAKRAIQWKPQGKHRRGTPQHTLRRTRMAELEGTGNVAGSENVGDFSLLFKQNIHATRK